jgi:hypothetical protein
MTFNRRVLEPHLNDQKKPLSLLFAIQDHPWVDTAYGAAVRIAMTVGASGNRTGRLLTIASESNEKSEADGRTVTFDHQLGKVFANLQIGADVASSKKLLANDGLSSPGVKLHGAGFKVKRAELHHFDDEASAIKGYMNGRDLAATSRDFLVIDLFGLDEAEVRKQFPKVYQRLLDTVKPERDQNNRQSYKDNWWLFGEARSEIRPALSGLGRYIATVVTAKHRFFTFVDSQILPDDALNAIALDDAAFLAVLSARSHRIWARANSSSIGMYKGDVRYLKTKCFDPFPFPDLTDAQCTHLRQLGEDLDAHRKRQQAAHPKLTLTQMYNVLEKLRAGDVIEGKDKDIYDQGLIGILRDLHDQIDSAVADAYGWPVDLSDEDILLRLVALNKERAEEEARGHIRWLRPEYQNPTGVQATKGKTTDMDLGVVAKIEKAPWPKTLPEQIAAVREALSEMGEATPEQIARRFVRGRAVTVEPLMDSLAALGQAERGEDGRYAA